MLIEVAAQATAHAGWPLRISDLPVAAALCRQRRLHSWLCLRPQAAITFVTRIPLFPYNCQSRRSRLSFVASAADSTPPADASAASSGKNIIPDDDEGFSLSKISFGVIGLAIGGSLLSYGFGAYFTILPGSEWSALMLTYGFPLAIIGMAFKYAELKPVPCITYSDAQSLRESCGTPILKQPAEHLRPPLQTLPLQPPPVLHLQQLEPSLPIGAVCSRRPSRSHRLLSSRPATTSPPPARRFYPSIQVRNDVIRFRYGDEQHLDEALKRIFQYGLGGGISRRSRPILQMIREEVTEDGKYCLVLVFEAKALQLSDFEQRQAKFASFFGPGINAEIGKGEGNDLYEVRLISQTTS